MYITLHVEYRYYGPISMKREFSRQIFEKYRNIKFYENPASERRVAPCGRTDGRTDMTKLIVPFRNYVNTSNNIE